MTSAATGECSKGARVRLQDGTIRTVWIVEGRFGPFMSDFELSGRPGWIGIGPVSPFAVPRGLELVLNLVFDFLCFAISSCVS